MDRTRYQLLPGRRPALQNGWHPHKRHIFGPLHCPFIVLFEQDCADEAHDGIVVRKSGQLDDGH